MKCLISAFFISDRLDFDLNVMRQGRILHITATVLTGMREVIEKVRPDVALVHGDTATTFAASLAAFYSKVKLDT